MRKLFSLTLLILCVACLSDTPQTCAVINIKNNTKYNVVLEAFFEKKAVAKIEVLKMYTFSKIQNLKFESFFGISPIEIDSVNIKFDDQKIIVQYCNGRNISFCDKMEKNVQLEFNKSYVKAGVKTKFNLDPEKCKILINPIELTIDQTDYDRAVPIKK